MRFWRPEPRAPHLLDWWTPLLKAARRALEDEVPWLIILDEWHLEGRVRRQGRPDIWVYVNRNSRGPLNVDHTGQPYRFIHNRSGPSPGRYKEVGIRHAVHLAGLSQVSTAVWYEAPAPSEQWGWEQPLRGYEEPSWPPTLRLVK